MKPEPPQSSPSPLLLHQTTNTSQTITTITLNRPKQYNALSTTLLSQLLQTLQSLDDDHNPTRVIILTGFGKAFCAGLDIKELKNLTTVQAKTKNFMTDWMEQFQNIRKPILAAVNGLALGGGLELALMCDCIYATSNSKFGFPEINIGTIPGLGGTQKLSRLIGKRKTMEMILMGEIISAKQAEKIGLINFVVDKEDDLLEFVNNKAEIIANKSLRITQMAKMAIVKGLQVDLAEGLKIEKDLYYETFDTPAFKEGTNAFLEKRKPNFEKI